MDLHIGFQIFNEKTNFAKIFYVKTFHNGSFKTMFTKIMYFYPGCSDLDKRQ